MRFQAKMLFTLGVVAVAGFAVYTAQDWPLGTGLFPRFVGIPAFVLSLLQLTLDIRASMQPENSKKTDTGDLQVDLNMEARVLAQKAGIYFGWLVGLFFGILIFGFFICIPLYSFLYLKIQAKEEWLLSSYLTLGVTVFFIGLFDQVLHIHWVKPLLPLPESLLKSLFPFLI